MNFLINKILNELVNINDSLYKTFIMDINKLNYGKVNPLIIQKLTIDYHNQYFTLDKLSLITVKNNSTIQLTLYDTNTLNNIYQAILKSNLGIQPLIKGDNIIYIKMPTLTVESKNLLTKVIKEKSEQIKICFRNSRREANKKLTNLLIKKLINKDEEYLAKNHIQKHMYKLLLKLDLFSKDKISLLM